MEIKSREVLLKEAFDEVRIIVSADCHYAAMKDKMGNYVKLSNGNLQFTAALHSCDGDNLPSTGDNETADMQTKVAQNLVRFVSGQSTMFIFNGEAQDFRKIDLTGVSLSDPKFIGKEGSASVYTVKPGLF